MTTHTEHLTGLKLLCMLTVRNLANPLHTQEYRVLTSLHLHFCLKKKNKTKPTNQQTNKPKNRKWPRKDFEITILYLEMPCNSVTDKGI